MNNQVPLKEIIEGMSCQTEAISAYLNKQTGKVVNFFSESLEAAEEDETLEDYSEWQQEEIAEAKKFLASPDDFIPLPNKFEIHEWKIMNRFCIEVKDLEIRDTLLESIDGNGAFRFFKINIERFNLKDDWYAFREKELRKIAIQWCEEHKLEFIE